MQFISALTTGVRALTDSRNPTSPQTVLQDAVSSLNEALSLLVSHSGEFPTASLQKHQATYDRLDHQAQQLAVNNSLSEAKALRKEAEQFQDEVRQQRGRIIFAQLQETSGLN